jgi:hypothetical protein
MPPLKNTLIINEVMATFFVHEYTHGDIFVHERSHDSSVLRTAEVRTYYNIR